MRQRHGLSPENEGYIVPSPVLRGGGVLTHYLITLLEMDGQHDTREGSSPETRRTARNLFSFLSTAVRQ